MSDTVFYGLIVILLLAGWAINKGSQWWVYRFKNLYRKLWLVQGKCPKCGEAMSRTASGRGICTNGNCRK